MYEGQLRIGLYEKRIFISFNVSAIRIRINSD
jgi:hypothetical protein